MTKQELIIDEQLPEFWRNILKNSNVFIHNNGLVLVKGDTNVLFHYDANRKLIIEVT